MSVKHLPVKHLEPQSDASALGAVYLLDPCSTRLISGVLGDMLHYECGSDVNLKRSYGPQASSVLLQLITL